MKIDVWCLVLSQRGVSLDLSLLLHGQMNGVSECFNIYGNLHTGSRGYMVTFGICYNDYIWLGIAYLSSIWVKLNNQQAYCENNLCVTWIKSQQSDNLKLSGNNNITISVITKSMWLITTISKLIKLGFLSYSIHIN